MSDETRRREKQLEREREERERLERGEERRQQERRDEDRRQENRSEETVVTNSRHADYRVRVESVTIRIAEE